MQNRYRDTELLSFLNPASDCRGIFGKAFGVFIPDLMFMNRSFFIADAEGVLQHVDVVSEFTHETDYDRAIDVICELV